MGNKFVLEKNFSESLGVAPHTTHHAVMGDVIEHSSGRLKNIPDEG